MSAASRRRRSNISQPKRSVRWRSSSRARRPSAPSTPSAGHGVRPRRKNREAVAVLLWLDDRRGDLRHHGDWRQCAHGVLAVLSADHRRVRLGPRRHRGRILVRLRGVGDRKPVDRPHDGPFWSARGNGAWCRANSNPPPISATPSSITARGPKRSIVRPINGLTIPDTTKPNENAPAVTPRSHPNSPMIGGKNSENAVRALTPIAMVTKVTATIIQP